MHQKTVDLGHYFNGQEEDNLVGQMRGKQVLAGGNIISESGSVLSLMGPRKRGPHLQERVRFRGPHYGLSGRRLMMFHCYV